MTTARSKHLSQSVEQSRFDHQPKGMKTITAFSGHLIRIAENQWQWSDGTPAPECRDHVVAGKVDGVAFEPADRAGIVRKAQSLGWGKTMWFAD